MHSRTARGAAVAGLVAMVLSGLATTSAAPASAKPAAPPAAEGRDGEDRPRAAGAAYGRYKGKRIDLSQGWQGATVCAEAGEADLRCYETAAEAEADLGPSTQRAGGPDGASSRTAGGTQESASTSAVAAGSVLSSCTYSYFCVFEHTYGAGRRLQFRDPGEKPLSNYSFRDQTSSTMNDMVSGKYGDIFDYRTGQPDNYLVWRWGSGTENLVGEPYPFGGNWNDKADMVRIRQL